MGPKSVSKYTDNLDEAAEVKLAYTCTVLGVYDKGKELRAISFWIHQGTLSEEPCAGVARLFSNSSLQEAMDRIKGSDSPIMGHERAEDLCKYAQIYDLIGILEAQSCAQE